MMEQRRSLLDGDATPTQERANVFGDEHEIEDEFEWDGMADGFRPNVDRDQGVERQDEVDGHPIRSISAHYAPGTIMPTIGASVNRNSTRKSRTYPNPFASPEDERTTSPSDQREHSLEFERDDILRKSISSASSSQFAPTHSPRFGAGPSHPYNIYPQTATLARTPSTATQSTVVAPSGRPSYSNNVPAHPYGMYPQGVGEDMDDEDDDTDDFGIRQNPVHVGFPGLGQNYTRRLGPDGEDQDLIGEDGHTEQLPPYTRYPEDAPEKAPLLMPTAPTALLSRAPVAGTDPSMPLMHTMIQPSATPAPQSMTDESTLHRQNSRMSSNLALIHSNNSSENSSIRLAKMPWKEKTWKEKRKTRFCAFGTFRGVAFQWILVVICVIAFVTALLGGVIGGFVAGGNHMRGKNPSITVVTSLYDASIIASPTSGAPPTGTFALQLGAPEETQCDCLQDKHQQVAWDCNLSPNSALAMIVGTPPNTQGSGAVLEYASFDSTIAYGAQLPYMNTTFAQFLTVQDQDDKQNGPAFYFQQIYDKVVVVPEAALTTSGSKSRKRGWYSNGWSVPQAWHSRKQLAAIPGEKPWFCVWNQTLLEGFIYVTESLTTTASMTQTSNNSMSSTTAPSSAGLTTATPTPTNTGATASYTHSGPANGEQVITTTFANPYTTATYTGPAAAFTPWSWSVINEANKRVAYAGLPVPHQKRDYGSSADDNDLNYWRTLDKFPFLVKLEERRVDGSPTPYCQQYQILDNGEANWVGDDNGKPIIIELNEQDPSYDDGDASGSGKMMHKRSVPNACHCQWMSGEN